MKAAHTGVQRKLTPTEPHSPSSHMLLDTRVDGLFTSPTLSQIMLVALLPPAPAPPIWTDTPVLLLPGASLVFRTLHRGSPELVCCNAASFRFLSLLGFEAAAVDAGGPNDRLKDHLDCCGAWLEGANLMVWGWVQSGTPVDATGAFPNLGWPVLQDPPVAVGTPRREVAAVSAWLFWMPEGTSLQYAVWFVLDVVVQGVGGWIPAPTAWLELTVQLAVPPKRDGVELICTNELTGTLDAGCLWEKPVLFATELGVPVECEMFASPEFTPGVLTPGADALRPEEGVLTWDNEEGALIWGKEPADLTGNPPAKGVRGKEGVLALWKVCGVKRLGEPSLGACNAVWLNNPGLLWLNLLPANGGAKEEPGVADPCWRSLLRAASLAALAASSNSVSAARTKSFMVCWEGLVVEDFSGEEDRASCAWLLVAG